MTNAEPKSSRDFLFHFPQPTFPPPDRNCFLFFAGEDTSFIVRQRNSFVLILFGGKGTFRLLRKVTLTYLHFSMYKKTALKIAGVNADLKTEMLKRSNIYQIVFTDV